MKHSETRPDRRSRRGFLSMELALTLPILGVVLFGLVEFALLLSARGTVVEASRVGARRASLMGATAGDVEADVLSVLNPRYRDEVRIEVDLGTRTGDVVAVAVAVPMDLASPDLLWPIGFGLEGRKLYSETRMVKE